MSSIFSGFANFFSPPKPITVNEAVNKGSQIFIHDEVIKSMKDMQKTVDAFNKDDSRGLMDLIRQYNQSLGAQNINIPQPVQNALMTFHSNVLANIDKADYNGLTESEAFSKIMGNSDAAMRALSLTVSKEMDERRERLLQNSVFKENREMAANITGIVDNMKKLKVKYKYFEYKYIEMNLFLILFVQKVYQTMDSFVKNVLDYNKMRDVNRDDRMKETLRLMVEIMKSADLELDPKHFEMINQNMAQMRERMSISEKEMQEKMQQLTVLTTENMAAFMDSFTNATKAQIAQGVGAAAKPSAAPKVNGSTQTMLNGTAQVGGFLRDLSVLPQAFYELGGEGASMAGGSSRS